MGYVYMFVFPNGKKYIGATIQEPKRRWSNGKYYKSAVGEAIKEFGWRSVTKLACWVPDSELDEQERYYIEKYKTTDPEFGYNNQSGGKKDFSFTDAALETMSDNRTGVLCGEDHPLYGTHRDNETKSKISQNRKGKTAGVNNPQYGKTGSASPNYGKHHSVETRRKQSEAAKRLWANRKQASHN
jgi:group I intron endonuclease